MLRYPHYGWGYSGNVVKSFSTSEAVDSWNAASGPEDDGVVSLSTYRAYGLSGDFVLGE